MYDRSDYSYIYCYDLNQQRLAMAQAEPDKGMEMGGCADERPVPKSRCP
jgi:hypothetical protein